MKFISWLKVALKSPPKCVGNLNEDDLRTLVNSIGIEVVDDDLTGLVTSNQGTRVKFRFDSAGSFSGVFAKIGGKNVNLIPGVSSSNLAVFKGAPTSTNPGVGWQIEEELTKEYFNQPNNQDQWKIFYASRVSIL